MSIRQRLLSTNALDSRFVGTTAPAPRVVHLGKYYPPALGGIENHTRTLATAQAELGADVRVVVVNHADIKGRDVTFSRLSRTRRADVMDGLVRVVRVGRSGHVAKLDLTPALGSVLREILRDPPDIWHLHTPNVTMLLAVLANSQIRPLVITHHSDIVRQRLLRLALLPLERAIYRRAAHIFPTSRAYIEQSPLLKQFSDKVTPLPLGIDTAPFAEPSKAAIAIAEELRIRFKSPLWLCVGRLIYYKGLHVALNALRDVPGTLLVIGSGPLDRELRALAYRIGVADRVVWHGSATMDEMVGAFQAATALWFPSVARSEAFGLVQVEAMAAGCPVINTAIRGSGVPWVCRHEREGLTAAVGDPLALAQAARRLLKEPTLRRDLAAAGRERAAEFDWRVMAERSLSAYSQIAAGSNNSGTLQRGWWTCN